MTTARFSLIVIGLLAYIPRPLCAQFAGPSRAAELMAGYWTQDLPPLLEMVLDTIVPALMAEFSTPGVAIALLEDRELSWQRTFGNANLATRSPLTDTTLFNVASISKVVTALGVMKLVEQGRVELDASVDRYLTRWKLPPSSYDRDGVTVRRILSHTAGLSAGGGSHFEPDEKLPTLEEALAGTAPRREPVTIVREPGSGFAYSNGGYGVLQLMIEEITGTSFPEYMRREILTPLGMTQSAFADPLQSEIAPHMAAPHDWRDQPMAPGRFANLAAGGLLSTLRDLVRLAEWELRLVDSSTIPGPVSSQTLGSMHVPQENAGPFGLGHIVRRSGTVTVVGHTGLETGWNASWQIAPRQGDAIVVLTNGDNGYYIHHVLVYLWSRVKLNAPLVSDGYVPVQKRLNRTAGVIQQQIESGEGNRHALTPIVARIEAAEHALTGRGPHAVLADMVELMQSLEHTPDGDALRIYLEGVVSWLEVLVQ